jgi:hypothetical protein
MMKHKHLPLAAALAAVLVVLGIGFHYLGPPTNQRAIHADERRVQDLRSIAQWINLRKMPLPASLTELTKGSQTGLNDPVTNAPYEYRRKAGSVYELCATFATGSAPGEDGFRSRSVFWSHPAGRHCYDLDASQPIPY